MIAIVTGMIATYPLGGVAWDYGQYALGLERLGYEVYYLEDTGGPTYDPRLREYTDDPQYGVAWLASALGRLSDSLGRRWHFRAMDGRCFGIERSRMVRLVARADVFLNVSGGTLLRDEYMPCTRKVLIDTDPGWNHFRNYPRADAHLAWGGGHGYRSHDFYFTYAERIGAADCVLPSLGIDWMPTRPPVVPDLWRAEPPGEVWTTVMTWKNFAEAIEYQGVSYGTKEMEFGRIENAPREIDVRFEIAVGGANGADGEGPAGQGQPLRVRWEALGWSVIDSHPISDSADAYRHYVQRSRGEFSVAKNVYVATRSGWFSCRSTCYLAAGRPVVVQDTGFSSVIPCGEGLLAFNSADEAVEAIGRIEGDYARHQTAARDIAARYFGAEVVLGDLLRRVGLTAA